MTDITLPMCVAKRVHAHLRLYLDIVQLRGKTIPALDAMAMEDFAKLVEPLPIVSAPPSYFDARDSKNVPCLCEDEP